MDRYREGFDANSGTYSRTSDWIECDGISNALRELSTSRQLGMDKSYEELVAQYGGKMQILCSGLYITKKNSTQTTFIEMGVESDDVSGKTARTEAAQEHWMFEKVSGELTLMRSLLNGDRDHDFLIVPPGHRIIATHKEGIVAVENHRD